MRILPCVQKIVSFVVGTQVGEIVLICFSFDLFMLLCVFPCPYTTYISYAYGRI